MVHLPGVLKKVSDHRGNSGAALGRTLKRRTGLRPRGGPRKGGAEPSACDGGVLQATGQRATTILCAVYILAIAVFDQGV